MNIKKTAKKIVAVGSGVALAGATFMGALAAAPDLSQYPSQFVDDGQFDGKIVVGAEAASQDIIGAIDIAASLQAASTEDVAVGDSTTTVDIEGDAKQIKESGDMLELGEDISSVTETLADGDLEMLSSGRISTQKGSTDYTQILELGSASVSLAENHDDEVGNFLKFDENQNLFTYELEFTSGLESDRDSNGVLDDIEDEVIPFLGQMYTVVQATGDASGDISLELIAGDVSDTLEQGQTRTYTVDGEDYEVTILVVGSNGQVKFLVNGEVTDSMVEGDTETVSGIEIGVREVLQSSRAFEGDQGSIVEFYLGANTITLTDSDISDGNAGDIEVDNEDLNDASLTIRGSGDSNTYRVNSIEYSLALDSAYKSDSYLAAGEGVREKLDEPEGMINAMWDIVYMGTSEPSTEAIEFDALGDDEYEFTFSNRRGDEFTVPYAYSTSSARGFGDEDDAFVFWERNDSTGSNYSDAAFHIGMDDYFLVTDNDDDDNGDSYVLQWDDVNEDDTTITFSNVGSGDSFEVSYSTLYNGSANTVATSSAASGEIRLGGKDFNFWLRQVGGSGDYTLAVDLDNDKSLGNEDFVNAVTSNGGIITLSNATSFADGSSWFATLTTDGDNIDTGSSDVSSNITFSHDATSDEFSSVSVSSDFGPVDDPDDDDREYHQSKYGTWFDIQGDDNGADDLSISYPSGQVEALVYVVGGDVSASTSTSGQTAQRLNVLPVGIAVLDSEVSSDDDNLIVVGGPCANTIAADLLGNPSDCTEGFQAGMGMIRTFDTGDNVAVLVAGYSARDTVESSRILARAATEDISNLNGDSVEVVIAGENDVSVRAALDESSEEDDSEMDEE